MCGFFSIHKKNNYIDNLDHSIQIIKSNLKRRGPDSQISLFLDNNFKINHNINNIKNLIVASRLNVIDNNINSNLPFISNCKQYILSFNGEIYNFNQLKKKYLDGIKLKTNSDSEVLLYLLKHRGEYVLNELNGIFSISFYDLKKKRIILARDRLGIKPLYYYFKNGSFLFSSDVKNFLVFNDIDKKINKNLSILFLNNISSVKHNETFFEGIRKIEGGKYLIFNIEDFHIEKYKNFWNITKNIDLKNFKSNELYNDLSKTVEKQSISNREIAITLSGGLDSSIIALLLRDLYPDRKINAYSFTFSQNQKIDEKYFSDLATKRFNLAKTEISFDRDNLLDSIRDTNYALSFPAYGLSNVAQNLVYKKINQDGIRVCYDGQGADEVFGGYHGYGSALMFSNFKDFKILTFFKNFYNSFKNKNMKTRFYLNFLSRFLSPKQYKFFLRFTDKSEIGDTLIYDKKKFEEYFTSFLNEKKITIKNKFRNEILYFLTKGIEPILTSLDSNSMNLGIETRVPFLDNFILDKYLLMNNDQCVSDKLIFKKLLRDAFSNKIPDQIINRTDKVGFSTDDNLLMKLKVDEIISDVNSMESNAIINKSNFLKVLYKYKNNKISNSSAIFKMYSYFLWCNQFKVYE